MVIEYKIDTPFGEIVTGKGYEGISLENWYYSNFDQSHAYALHT